jgi:ankyrin repeat protein
MDHFTAALACNFQLLRATLTVDNVNDIDKQRGLSALQYAAGSANAGYLDCIKCCLEMHANVNVRAVNGSTALHFASTRGHADVVSLLLDVGAVVDVVNVHGCTPLYCAISYERIAIARHLIDRGAKVSNVKVDKDVPAIPDSVTLLVESRSKCRFVAIVIIGIHKYRRTNITSNNDINVLRLIGKHIWSMRMEFQKS